MNSRLCGIDKDIEAMKTNLLESQLKRTHLGKEMLDQADGFVDKYLDTMLKDTE